MKTIERLRVSAAHTIAIVIAAWALWTLQLLVPPETELQFRTLLGPVLAAALVSLLVSLLLWTQGREGWRRVLKLPDQFNAKLCFALWVLVRLLRVGAWLAIVLSVGLSFASTRAEPGTYYYLIGGLAGILAFVALVRVSSIRFPAASLIFPVPWVRLGAFITIYLLLHIDRLTEHGFPNSQLILALWTALSASYAGDTLGKTAEIAGEVEEPKWWLPPPALLQGAAALFAGTSAGLIVWGALGSLPNVSALLLNEWPHLLIGYATQSHFSQFYEARHLSAAFVAGLYFVIKLPPGEAVADRVDYRPLAKAVGYSVVGAAAWLIGGELADLGHGFPLAAAAIACGFFAAGLSHMARYHTSSSIWVLSATARLLSKSVYRTAMLGVFLAMYGLLVRPLVYDVMWFAPIYEWVAVVLFAVVAINRMRGHTRTQVLPEGGPPADWPRWSRHVQTVEQRPDTRFEGLLDLQKRYVDTGRWGYLWRYMLGLLLRNRAPLDAIPEVFEPMMGGFEDSLKWDPWPRRGVRARRRRDSALTETMSRMDAALAKGPEPLPEISEERVRSVGQPFVEDGARPELLAVTLAAAYWQKGAPLDLAVSLWFPLLTMTKGVRLGLFSLVRSGERSGLEQKTRRLRVLDAAISHLFRGGTANELPLVVLADPAPVSDRAGGYVTSDIPEGQAIEVLSEDDGWWRVRTGDDQKSFMTPADAVRRRILPGD